MVGSESPQLYVERALFFIGDHITGKSTQIRSMFRDWRLGNKGRVPKDREGGRIHALSNERWLYIRRRSPHESRIRDKTTSKQRTLSRKDFLNDCKRVMPVSRDHARRWNFVCPLWPRQVGATPEALTLIDAFKEEFNPERVRVVLSYPKSAIDSEAHSHLLRHLDKLRRLPMTETIITDWRDNRGNGLIYSDFFDFT